MDQSALVDLVGRYRADPESVYNTWFTGSAERLKAFRSIRRGVKEVTDSIADGTFGNDFKGSPLETVLAAITEQKQVFEGAAHPFYWKPKLRIPDIYENAAHQRTFGAFLAACLTAGREGQILAEMSKLAAAQIKGLGPACANIVYFLHPTIVPPFNTAMVNGFNALFGTRKKLGSWASYLEMREVIVQTNAQLRPLLSNDLGALAGLLYEVGIGRLVIPGNAERVLDAERQAAEKAARLRHSQVLTDQHEESAHTRMQYLLIRIGRALGYAVYVARNDRHRAYDGHAFAQLTIPALPPLGWPPEVADTVGLIDTIWLRPDSQEIVCAFEVEKSTSIYSGILRLQDLARSIPGCACRFYLLAPAAREREVLAQFARPAFRDNATCGDMGLITFETLAEHCEALCKFADSHSALRKIARHVAGG